MSFDSLAQLIEYRSVNDWDRIFLSSPEQQLDVTYGAFYQEAKKLAQHLEQRGLRQNQRVALLMDNGLNWTVAFAGVLLAGGAVVPLNPGLTPGEIADLLEKARVRMMITVHEKEKTLPPQVIAGRKAQPIRYRTAFAGQEDLSIFAVLPQEPADRPGERQAIQATDEALLLFTSGSTGVPKGVVLTHGNLLAEADFIRQGHKLTASDIVLCILPFFHINGLVITLVTSLFSGGRAVVPRKFSASQFWKWAGQYQVTWFSAVPTILSILLSRHGEEHVDVPSLRFARSASSSLPVAVLEAFEQRYHIPVIEGYGLSEASSQVATNPLPPEPRKAGSVGRPVGNEIRVVDGRGHAVPPGVTGEVTVKGANVTQGYLNNPEANRESFKNGWFYTGDLGRFDEDGYLFLTGRRKELINRAGEKISPREVDEVLYRLPDIETAAAIGVPDPLFGEEIVAFVQLRPGAELGAEQVARHCKACLADFKVPKRILFIDDFPKGPNGKIQRRQLVELYLTSYTEDVEIN